MHAEKLQFPIILKPDVGERGGDVKLAKTLTAARAYLRQHQQAMLAQAYHPGPVEIGIFWAYDRQTRRDHSFHYGQKFPVIHGDGQRTVAQLLQEHRRFRNQYHIYAERHQEILNRVLDHGETLQLTSAGNHSQGCLFQDGGHLITPALIATCNRWMSGQDQLRYGRFDVRAASYDDIRAGRDLAVVEMNGLSSEPTALYDPSWSYPRAVPRSGWLLGSRLRPWRDASRRRQASRNVLCGRPSNPRTHSTATTTTRHRFLKRFWQRSLGNGSNRSLMHRPNQ